MKRSRAIQLIFLSSGLFVCLTAIFYDLIPGKNANNFGKLQWIALILGSILFLIGLVWQTKEMKSISFKVKEYFLKEIPSASRHKHHSWIFDTFTIATFSLIAVAFFFGRWKGADPVIDLGSDAANVATFAAVLDNPQNFANDFLFNKTSNFSFYVSLHLPYLQFFSKLLGGYGIAYLSLLVPIIFIQLIGFYFFGKVLFRNRFWSLLLAILSLLIIYTGSSDYWGIYKDPQPRMLFGALFPWLLTLAYSSFKKPKLRIATMVLVGLMLYIHPVSTPAVAFSIWLGFLFNRSDKKRVVTHLLELFGLGLIFISMAIPFSLTYISSRNLSPSVIDYSTSLALFKTYNLAMFDIIGTLQIFLKSLTVSWLLPIAAIFWVIGRQKTKYRFEMDLFLIWVIGLLVVSVGVTHIESVLDTKFQVLPVLLELNRDLRYIVPILEIIIVVTLAGISNAIQLTTWSKVLQRGVISIAGIFIILLLAVGYRSVTKDILDMHGYAQQAVTCWFQGDLFCPDPSPQDRQNVLSYITNHTDTSASFISIPPTNLSKLIRYQGLRSVSFDIDDTKTYIAVDIAKYLSLNPQIKRWQHIQTISDEGSRFLSYLDFAKAAGANYAVVSANDVQDFGVGSFSVIYSSGFYAIIKL
jgi:hypothetical protein